MTGLLKLVDKSSCSLIENPRKDLRRGRFNVPDFVLRLKEQALKFLDENGLPPRSDPERWRYHRTKDIFSRDFTEPRKISDQELFSFELNKYSLKNLNEIRIVFLDGQFCASLSNINDLPEGIILKFFSEIWQDDILQQKLAKLILPDQNSLAALNMLNFSDGLFIEIQNNRKLDNPIHISYISSGLQEYVCFPRVLIHAKSKSQSFLIEDFLGLNETPYLIHAVAEITIEDHAQVDHYKIQRENSSAYHFQNVAASLQSNSQYSHNLMNVGGYETRLDLVCSLTAPHSHVVFNGLNFFNQDQHGSTYTTINHQAPDTQSEEFYRCVVNDSATAVFNGKILVAPNCEKSLAQQKIQSLLLSENAEVNAKPELEIYTDDVSCSHGATIGHVDDDMLFYLLSRGISRDEANFLLTLAFATEVIQRFQLMPLRSQLDVLLRKDLN